MTVTIEITAELDEGGRLLGTRFRSDCPPETTAHVLSAFAYEMVHKSLTDSVKPADPPIVLARPGDVPPNLN